jgi:hypothetical protein
MSTTASVGNFYVDSQGVKQPIRYKAADLVNVPAPVGYTWFKSNYNRSTILIFIAR